MGALVFDEREKAANLALAKGKGIALSPVG